MKQSLKPTSTFKSFRSLRRRLITNVGILFIKGYTGVHPGLEPYWSCPLNLVLHAPAPPERGPANQDWAPREHRSTRLRGEHPTTGSVCAVRPPKPSRIDVGTPATVRPLPSLHRRPDGKLREFTTPLLPSSPRFSSFWGPLRHSPPPIPLAEARGCCA